MGLADKKRELVRLLSDGKTVYLDEKNTRVGISKKTPQTTLHVGGIAGIDGIMFPDDTLQITAATARVITALNNATENELVTVGATTTELDAEANLTFDGSTLTLTGDLLSNGAAVFNDAGADKDFRVESDNNDYMLFVDGGSDLLHIGENLGKGAKLNNVQDFTGVDPHGFATDGDMGGDIIKIGSTSTTLSNLYFLTDSSAWTATDADAESTAAPVLLALALGTHSGNHGMLIRGFARISSSLLASTATAKQGDPIYISTTTGGLTFTAPSGTGDIVRIVGYLVVPVNSNSDSVIYFCPDNTWVKLS